MNYWIVVAISAGSALSVMGIFFLIFALVPPKPDPDAKLDRDLNRRYLTTAILTMADNQAQFERRTDIEERIAKAIETLTSKGGTE